MTIFSTPEFQGLERGNFEFYLKKAKRVRQYDNLLVPLPLQEESFLKALVYENYPLNLASPSDLKDTVNHKFTLQQEYWSKDVQVVVPRETLYYLVGSAKTMLQQMDFLLDSSVDFYMLDPDRSSEVIPSYNFCILDERIV